MVRCSGSIATEVIFLSARKTGNVLLRCENSKLRCYGLVLDRDEVFFCWK